MLGIAVRMLRARKGSVIATLISLTVGVAILMACGLLLESGLRYRGDAQRYADADAVVAQREVTYTADEFGEPVSYTVPLPERGSVPVSMVEAIEAVPGVAEAVADHAIPLAVPAAPEVAVVGRGWGSTGLAPYRIVSGAAPAADGEVAVAAGVASAAGLRPGQRTGLLVGGVVREYTVAGVVQPTWQVGTGRPVAVFFTDAEAARLGPYPGRVDAIGVRAEPGADHSAVMDAVRQVADGSGARVYTGADRGLAEEPEATEARELAIIAGGSFGGYVAILAIFVTAGTVGLSVRHRRRDLALLRAVAATPGQVRRLVLAEVGLVTVLAALIGVPAGLLTTVWARGELVERGFVPASFTLEGGWLAALAVIGSIAAVAVSAAMIAAWRNTRIRPTEALGEVSVEPARPGRVRLAFGLVFLAGGLALTMVTTATGGLAAIGAASGMLYTFVLAVALLAPWINAAAAKLLGPVLRTGWGTSGYLAAANLRANARGMVPVLTALVLAVGFGGSIWFVQDNLRHHTLAQSRDGMLADRALVSTIGLPDAALGEVRRIPGVAAATAVRQTGVVTRGLDGAQALPAQAVDVDSAATTMDLRVREGDLADLDATGVAVSHLEASSAGWELGEPIELWLGDGTPVTLRVVAIYERGLGFGDVTLDRATVVGHTGTDLDDRILIRTADPAAADAALAGLAARYPGARVVDADALTGELDSALAVSAWLNKLLIAVLVGYAALAAANTMIMAAMSRSRELSLLRLVGVTRRQVRRMVHAEQVGLLGVALAVGGAIAVVTLSSIVAAVAGTRVPYVPWLGMAVVLGGTALLALVATILPIRRLLRTAPVDGIGVRE